MATTPEEALRLLRALGSPPRLLQHAALVGEAGEALLAALAPWGVGLDAAWVRAGIALHDAGKVLHPEELDAPGARHEAAGEALLRAHGVAPELARICRTHARWAAPDVALEELVVALADRLWKGVRHAPLEERVIDAVAARAGRSRWDLFTTLDDAFEAIAAGGADRLARSRA